MCAIYGSANRTLFNILHDVTIDRGKFACSVAFLDHKNKKIQILRQKGHPKDFEKIPETSDKQRRDYAYFLGHSQAPTSSAREYNSTVTHPFVAANWIVAHNGVLTNYKDINKTYCSWNKNPVDTSCIPNLLHALEQKNSGLSEVKIILKALELLEGTFALWIINEKTGSVFIARQGSTLFANKKTGSFCSVNSNSENWEEVAEGVLVDITAGYKEVGNFKNKSPFFVL